MEFRVLGPVQVKVGREESTLASDEVLNFEGVPAAVITVLALHQGERVSKTYLQETIWRGGGELNAIETAIGRIRQRLGLGARDKTFLVTEPSAYRLAADTDVLAFEDHANRADQLRDNGRTADALLAYDDALAVWRGEPGNDLLADALDTKAGIEALHRMYQTAQLSRLKLQVQIRNWPEARSNADRILAKEPFLDAVIAIKIQAIEQLTGARAAHDALVAIFRSMRDNETVPNPELRKLRSRLLEALTGNGEVDADSIVAEPPPTPPPLQIHSDQHRIAEPDSTEPEPELVEHNLPARTYMQFIPRRQWAELEQALAAELPIIGLVGIGGNGKSALAREFADHLVRARSPFRFVVWVSDREVPGSTSLNTVLDELATTVGDRNLATLSLPDKRRQATRLLRRSPTLLVVDSFETVTDEALTKWLPNVPTPSRVLITSTVHVRSLDDYWREIEVDGLDVSQRDQFYEQLLTRRNLQDLMSAGPALATLWAVSWGNPKLIEWSIGQVKSRGRTLDEIIHEIRDTRNRTEAARRSDDFVLGDLFRNSWTDMSPAEIDVLTASACFPYGTTKEVLREISGRGDSLEDSLEALSDLCFVSRLAHHEDGATWYAADPLARSRPAIQHGSHSDAIHDRWIQYWIEFTEAVGFCPGDVSRLQVLDAPGARDNLEYALTWAYENGRFGAVVQIAREARYYYYVRGLWSAQPNVHLLRADAARQIEDAFEEFDARVYYLNIASKQENLDAIRTQLPRLEELMRTHATALSPKSASEYRHARALYLLAVGEHEHAVAEWRTNLSVPDALGPENYNANMRWLAICLSKMGSPNASEAIAVFATARRHAVEHNYDRALFLIDLELAAITLDRKPTLPVISQTLEHLLSSETVSSRDRLGDRRYTADHAWLVARCYLQLGQPAAAAVHSMRAADLFDRLGLIGRAAIARTAKEA